MPAKPATNPGIERGDHVYARHPKRGAITMRVTATGKDGFRGTCEAGERWGVPFTDYLGHKARMMKNYSVVDAGADGAILAGPDGKRRFVAGGLPGGPVLGAEPAAGPGAAELPAKTKPMDPLLDGLDRMNKALRQLEHGSFGLPAAPAMFAKGMGAPMKNRPGLSLQNSTDRDGTQTHRWVRLVKKEGGAEEGAKPANVDAKAKKTAAAPPVLKHGDTVKFKHGEVHGEGVIIGSGKDGVTVADKDGREQQVRHEHLIHPGQDKPAGEVQGETGEAGGDGGSQPPATFDAHSYAAERNDPKVTAEDILKAFPPDTKAKMDQVNADLKAVGQTIDKFRKDGAYTPERAAVHAKIIDHILNPEIVAAATPPEGQKPTFTVLGGRGGSGKSWFANKVYDPKSALVLDSDEIKKMLPEYKGWNAAEVHEESGDIFDRITEAAQTLGINLVHDSTMKSGHKVVALVNKFKDSGYNTAAHYMYLPPQVAAKRGVERFLGPTKRFVPPGVILGNVTNEASFDQVKNLVDNWSFRDNNVGKGEQPKLISESANEADERKSGLPGQPTGLREQPGEGVAATAKDAGRAQGKTSGKNAPFRKALGGIAGDDAVLFLKAAMPGSAVRDLFEGPVTVKGHVTREGVIVKPHTRKVKHHAEPAAPDKKHYYVSAINDKRRHLVAGPYPSHQEALDRVDDVFKHADKADPRAWFMYWGTAGSDDHHKTPLGENWKPAL